MSTGTTSNFMKMFRVIRGFQFQKFLLEKFLYAIQWPPQPSNENVISSHINPPAQSYVQTTRGGIFGSENVVITGGAEGLGRALAIKLGRLNATVAIWDSNKKSLEETENMVKVVGGRVVTYLCDLTSREDIYRIAEETKREIGQITMLINNADIATGRLLLDTPDSLIQRAFDINVLSHFWAIKAFLPNMIEGNKGHIVTIASMAGHMGIQKLTDYCATKSAILGFMAALRTELEREGSKGIKITTICPYFMSSNGICNDAELRFVSALNPEDVADRTIKAITEKEYIVFMPGWFKLTSFYRWLTPWPISYLLKRILIKDPNPSSVKVEPTKIIQFVRSSKPGEQLKSEAVPKGPANKSASEGTSQKGVI